MRRLHTVIAVRDRRRIFADVVGFNRARRP